MTVNTLQKGEPTEVVSVREKASNVRMLEAAQMKRGHATLNDTLREAIEMYLDHTLLRPGRCPLDPPTEEGED